MTTLRAPFPYFGGKSDIAEYVWSRLGNPKTYIEPFFGSGAMLLARPHPPQIEIANDVCDFLSNFWRAVKFAPEEVAEWADWPVLECDLHARHYWLITERRARLARIMGDPMAGRLAGVGVESEWRDGQPISGRQRPGERLQGACVVLAALPA